MKKRWLSITASVAVAAMIFSGATRRSLAAEGAAPSEDGIPTWDAASPLLINNLQEFMKTDIGQGLVAQIPSLSLLRDFDADSAAHQKIMGAMAKHLYRGFNARLTLTLASSKNDKGPEMAALADEIIAAHDQAAPEVAFVLQYQAEEAAAGVVRQQTESAPYELMQFSDLLKDYSFYGPLITKNPKIRAFQKLAQTTWVSRNMDKAKDMARELLRGSHFFIYNDGAVIPMRNWKPKYSRQEVLAEAAQFPDHDPDEVSQTPYDVAAAPIDGPTMETRSNPSNNGEHALEPLRRGGRLVEWLAPTQNPEDPRFKISGKNFGFYAPMGGNAQSIVAGIIRMVQEGRIDGIVLDLDDSAERVANIEARLALKSALLQKLSHIFLVVSPANSLSKTKIKQLWPLTDSSGL